MLSRLDGWVLLHITFSWISMTTQHGRRGVIQTVWYSFSSDSSAEVWEQGHTHTQSDTAEQTPLCSLSWLNHHFPVKSRSTMTRENIIHLMTHAENWLNWKITRKLCSSKRNLPKQQFPTCTFLDSIKLIFNHIIHEMFFSFFSSHIQSYSRSHKAQSCIPLACSPAAKLNAFSTAGPQPLD